MINEMRKYHKVWSEIMREVSRLPRTMQLIVLDDINDAVKNRVKVMECIIASRGREGAEELCRL